MLVLYSNYCTEYKDFNFILPFNAFVTIRYNEACSTWLTKGLYSEPKVNCIVQSVHLKSEFRHIKRKLTCIVLNQKPWFAEYWKHTIKVQQWKSKVLPVQAQYLPAIIYK